MSNIHLDEEQLQRYAMDGSTDPATVAHIASCMHCQLQVSAYQMLYSHVQEEEMPLLDVDILIPAFSKKETYYLYGLLFGALALFMAVVAGCWSMISPVFSGFPAGGIVLGALLLLGVLALQLLELYGTYDKKIKTLQPGSDISVSLK